ncbi:MAG: ABC transporter substrate-binding protein, partial [Acetobacteraceae bacterium]|nr:ABC transporter substrate-binding protein [Acetobacteraceae bacterium]
MQFLRANGERAWFGWPDVPRLVALREAWFDAPDLAAAQAIAREIQAVVFDQAPYLPSGQYFGNTAFRRSITEPVSEIYAFWEVRRA